jgi:hypothetical protein
LDDQVKTEGNFLQTGPYPASQDGALRKFENRHVDTITKTLQKAIWEVMQKRSTPHSRSHVFKLQLGGFRAFSSRLCSLDLLFLFHQGKRNRPRAAMSPASFDQRSGLSSLLALPLILLDGYLNARIQSSNLGER